MPLRPSTILLALPLLLAANTAAAQGATSDSSHVPISCTYLTCALRMETGIFSAPRLVRGAAGGPIDNRLTILGGGIDPLLAVRPLVIEGSD